MNTPNVTSGGLVLFVGGRNPLKAGPGFLLTDLIDALTHSKFSHSAILMPSSGAAPYIYESTIENHISGPQRNGLAGTLAGYAKQNAHAFLFPFLPQFNPDWAGVETAALGMIARREAGQLPYDVSRLFADAEGRSWVFDLVALPADGIIAYLGAHNKGLVCSEMAGLLIQSGGVVPKMTAAGVPWLPTITPPGQPIGCSPQDLSVTPIFAAPVQIV